jgi:hypothetical protein
VRPAVPRPPRRRAIAPLLLATGAIVGLSAWAPAPRPRGCDPADRRCWVTLTPTDSAVVALAMSRVKAPAEFRDRGAADVCGRLLAKYDELQRSGRPWLYRGSTEVGEGPDEHTAASVRDPRSGERRVHIDGDRLNVAADANHPQRMVHVSLIADLILHEIAHMLDYPAHAGESSGVYQTSPYNYTSGGLTVTKERAERCVW